MGSLSLLQGIFLTQESNWDLLHCQRILYQLSYQGSQYIEKDINSELWTNCTNISLCFFLVTIDLDVFFHLITNFALISAKGYLFLTPLNGQFPLLKGKMAS